MGGRGETKPKDNRTPPPLSLPFLFFCPPVLDATRTLTLTLALAANFFQISVFFLLYIPPIKTSTGVLIHQAVLEEYCIGGEETAVDLSFNSSPWRDFLGDFQRGGVWDQGDKLLDPILCFSRSSCSSICLHNCTQSGISGMNSRFKTEDCFT